MARMSESRRMGPSTPPAERLVAAPRRTRSVWSATSFSCASLVTTSCAPTIRSPPRTMYLLGSTLRRSSSRRRSVSSVLGSSVARKKCPARRTYSSSPTLQILGVRQHLVPRHCLLTGAAPHDQLGRLLAREHARASVAERQGAVEQLAQGLFQSTALAALGQVRRFGRRERQSLGLGGLLNRPRPALVRRRLEGREQGVHRGLDAVDRPLLKLIDRLHAAGQLLGLARELLVGLVHGEGERRDHIALGRGPDGERLHVGGARGERERREQRQADHPDPALAVIAQLLLCREPHVSPARP